MEVGIRKDGEISMERKQKSRDELTTRAARNGKKWFTIRREEGVLHAKVVPVVEAWKDVGVPTTWK